MNKRQKKKQLKKQLEQRQLKQQLEREFGEQSEQQSVTQPEQQPEKIEDPKKSSDTSTEQVSTEEMAKETPAKKRIDWLLLAVIPFTFLFQEIVLACSTKGKLFGQLGLYLVLFSAGYGLICHFLCSLIPNRKAVKLVQGIVIALSGVLYTIIYYLYCEFQVFYDLNTMLAGATDAVQHFTGDIVSIVCSFDGFAHLILFFLPFMLVVIQACLERKRHGKECASVKKNGKESKEKKKQQGAQPKTEQFVGWKYRLSVVCVGVLCFLFAVGLIQGNSMDKDAYGALYNYGAAVERFGLLTGIRLEIKNAVGLGQEEEGFEFVSMQPTEFGAQESITTQELQQNEGQTDSEVPHDDARSDSAETETVTEGASEEEPEEEELVEEEPEEPVILGDNVMDIDFSALAEKDGGAYADLDQYVASLTPSNRNAFTGMFKGKNLIFMTAEAFTAEAVREDLTPTLYRLANKGIQFTDYYQPASAGTTGGEYSNLFGMLPSLGGQSVKETATHLNWTTMASRLTAEGYYGKAYHNNDYTYYDRHKTHINLGFSDGYEGFGNGLESIITRQWPESDLEMLQGTFPLYEDKQPFHIYYMTVSGHSLYGFDKNAMARKHREEVENLPYSDTVKAYLGSQLELEAALTYLVEQLEQKGIADDTVIVISADHFPYGLDQNSGELTYLSELYERPIENNLVRDHNRLIIWSGCLEKMDPILVDTPTCSIDVLPTLCNLFGVEYDSRLLPGRDVFSDTEPLVYTLGYEWKTTLGTFASGRFTPVSEEIEIPEDYVKTISAIVKNKIVYSKGVVQKDYFRHVFSTEEE